MARKVKLLLPSQDSQSASTPLTPTPVSNLHQDILWQIFSVFAHIKGNENNPRALTSLRHLSQVSMQWRKLILASSSLWGRVIDFACLLQPSDDWRIEVLRRTGDSPLCIQAWLGQNDPRLEAFLALLLNDHWSRIRWLNIGLGKCCALAEEAMWRVFQTPAPQLEYFSVHLERPPARSLLAKIGTNMFGGHAPFLRHFASFDFKIRPQNSWLSNVRSLHFTSLFTAPEFLDALFHMPFLETLEIFADVEEADLPVVGAEALQTVTLPHLRDFDVHTGRALTKYLAILEHLTLPAGCEFRFQTGISPLVESNLIAAQRVLQSAFQLHFKEWVPHDLTLTMDKRRGNISASGFSFSFGVEFESDSPDPCMLLKAMTSSSVPLENITRLSVSVLNLDLPPDDATFNHLISSLASVEKLEVTPNSLRLLSSFLTVEGAIHFPSLTKLIFTEFDTLDPGILFDFLARRKELDVPLEVLDLTKDPECRLGCYTLDSLDQVDRLRVVWYSGEERQEYVCGSGNPIILDFACYQ